MRDSHCPAIKPAAGEVSACGIAGTAPPWLTQDPPRPRRCSRSTCGTTSRPRAAGWIWSDGPPTASSTTRLLAAEVAEDRDQLLAVLRRLDVARPAVSEWVVGIAERVGRLKPNGTLLRRSPLSDVIELEALCTAVEAKRLGWVTLRLVADGDPRLDPADLDVLVARAADQQDRLERLRQRAVVGALAPAGSRQ